MHGGFYDTLARGRFGTVSYFNVDDHHHWTCFGKMAGWIVVICSCGHGCTILATFGSPHGSRGTTDAELM